MAGNLAGIGFLHFFREIADQFPGQIIIVGHAGMDQIVKQGDLGIGKQHADLGAAQGAALLRPFRHGDVVRQQFNLAVQEIAGFQALHQTLLMGEGLHFSRFAERDREGLEIVVAQAQIGDFVGHRRQQPVALLHVQLIGPQGRAQGDFDVHLKVRGIDAGGIIDCVGIAAAAMEVEFDPRLLGRAQIGAFADHLGTDFGCGNADLVVRPVAGIGIGFVGGANIGADAAKPHQVDIGFQDGAHHFEWRRLGLFQADGVLDFLRQGDRFR